MLTAIRIVFLVVGCPFLAHVTVALARKADLYVWEALLVGVCTAGFVATYL